VHGRCYDDPPMRVKPPLDLLVTRAEIAHRVTGSAGIGSPIGTIDLPFDHRAHVALPRHHC